MNPCIDCRIFLLKKAKKYAKEVGADFIFTGEVLDERPISQHYTAMKLIENEAGLQGRILRPLSARLLPETDAEKKGLVDRSKLMTIQGQVKKAPVPTCNRIRNQGLPLPRRRLPIDLRGVRQKNPRPLCLQETDFHG